MPVRSRSQSPGEGMSDDGKDAGLVAMITSILGGNKRADTPPLAEAPPTAPANEPEAVEPRSGGGAGTAVGSAWLFVAPRSSPPITVMFMSSADTEQAAATSTTARAA